MLFVGTRSRLLPSLPFSSSSSVVRPLKHLLLRRRPLLLQSRPAVRHLSCTSSSIKMSVASQSNQIVEHVVLFKVKDNTDPSKVSAMINGLSGLTSLDQVLHLTAGPLLRCRSSSLTFTHILHSRYNSKSDLSDYSAHPSHVSVVQQFVRPIVDDVMAVDWVVDDLGGGPISPPSGSAMRVTFLKMKANLGENEESQVLSVIGEMKNQFPSIQQLSVGENFSLDRAKGFSIASIAVFPGVNELDGLDSNAELINLQKEKVRDLLDGVVVLDYVLPSQQSASL